MKLVAVDGRAGSEKLLRAAIKTAATQGAAIQLLTVNDDYDQTFALDYHGDEKYPVLERIASQSDLLDKIIKPRTPKSRDPAPVAK